MKTLLITLFAVGILIHALRLASGYARIEMAHKQNRRKKGASHAR